MITPLLDHPASNPELSYDEYAIMLSQFLLNADPKNITIGLFGSYGTGKTTLMRRIKSKLDDNKEIIQIEFNPWRYDHEEYLFLPFLSAIASHDQITKESSLREKLKGTIKGFLKGLTLKTSFLGLELEASGEHFDSNESPIDKILGDYIDVYKALSGIPSSGTEGEPKKSVVVYIDDLDRCMPEKAFSLLESLKSFMDIDGFMFVLCLDPRAIKKYIYTKYDMDFPITTSEYIEKMIQVPFYLPNFDGSGIRSAILPLLNNIDSKWSSSFIELFESENRIIKSLINSLPLNIRQVKRILNIHQMLLYIKPNDNIYSLLLAIVIIHIKWPSIYKQIHRDGEYYSNNIKTYIDIDNLDDWKEFVDEVFLNLLKDNHSNGHEYFDYLIPLEEDSPGKSNILKEIK